MINPQFIAQDFQGFFIKGGSGFRKPDIAVKDDVVKHDVFVNARHTAAAARSELGSGYKRSLQQIAAADFVVSRLVDARARRLGESVLAALRRGLRRAGL